MGVLRNLIAGRRVELIDVAGGRGPSFAVDVDPGVLYGSPTLDDYVAGRVGKVRRAEALRVPAVLRGRNLVAGPIGTLPMRLAKPGEDPVEWPFLEQPEEGTAASVTWTRVADDLIFHGRAWLLITHRGWHGFPVSVRRLDPETVTIDAERRVWHTRRGSGTAAEYLPDDRVIRIDSPTEPILDAGAVAIRTCLAIARATRNVADGLPPSTYFTPADGTADYLTETEVQKILDTWHESRQKNVTGYVPAALELKALGWNPEQLQLRDLRDQAVLDIARLFGVDAEELNVSTTSRTYFNAFDRRQDFIQFTLAPYLSAIEGRLSMDDVTPRGYRVRFDLDEFFKADTLARFQAYEVGLRTGAVTVDEIREAEGRPALTDDQVAALAALAGARTPKEHTDASV